ncbi:hypothetical protein RB195_026558 [Necator americanus]|uniref:Uncharacterized protein n=1 Tax=Necator americanus TaxID=51031 RepID=A0ABR1EXG6_NECAM
MLSVVLSRPSKKRAIQALINQCHDLLNVPGYIFTSITQKQGIAGDVVMKGKEKMVSNHSRVPYQRTGKPEEVAEAVLFLAESRTHNNDHDEEGDHKNDDFKSDDNDNDDSLQTTMTSSSKSSLLETSAFESERSGLQTSPVGETA